MKGFEYSKDEGFQWPKIVRNMPDIQEEIELQSEIKMHENSQNNFPNLHLDEKILNESQIIYNKLTTTDAINDKVT